MSLTPEEMARFTAAEILNRVSPSVSGRNKTFADYLLAGFGAGVVVLLSGAEQNDNYLEPAALRPVIAIYALAVLSVAAIHLMHARVENVATLLRAVRKQVKADQEAGRTVNGDDLAALLVEATIWPVRLLNWRRKPQTDGIAGLFRATAGAWRLVQWQGLLSAFVLLLLCAALAVIWRAFG